MHISAVRDTASPSWYNDAGPPGSRQDNLHTNPHERSHWNWEPAQVTCFRNYQRSNYNETSNHTSRMFGTIYLHVVHELLVAENKLFNKVCTWRSGKFKICKLRFYSTRMKETFQNNVFNYEFYLAGS